METTKAILAELQKTLCDQFAAELGKLPMKKSVRELLIDGYKDGCRQGIHHAVKMLGVEVKE